MIAQVLHFDGPRGPELVAAAAFAGRERITPIAENIPGLLGGYVLLRPDGGELVIVLAETEQALQSLETAVMTTPLLPTERPELLPGPDRAERLEVATVFGRSMAAAAGGATS